MRATVCCVCGHRKYEKPKFEWRKRNDDEKKKKVRGMYRLWRKIARCNICSDKCENWFRSERPGVCAFHGEL